MDGDGDEGGHENAPTHPTGATYTMRRQRKQIRQGTNNKRTNGKRTDFVQTVDADVRAARTTHEEQHDDNLRTERKRNDATRLQPTVNNATHGHV